MPPNAYFECKDSGAAPCGWPCALKIIIGIKMQTTCNDNVFSRSQMKQESIMLKIFGTIPSCTKNDVNKIAHYLDGLFAYLSIILISLLL